MNPRWSAGIVCWAAITLLALTVARAWADDPSSNLLPAQPVDSSGMFSIAGGYHIVGQATPGMLGNARRDTPLAGVAFHSAARNGQPAAGSVSIEVAIDPTAGRWLRFKFRGLPQDGFAVADTGLFMQVEFLGGQDGTTRYDGKRKELYPLIQQARRDLTANGDLHIGGAAVWRDYVLDFYVPFPQVNRLKLTVGFDGGYGDTSRPPLYRSPRPTRGSGPPPEHLDTAGDAFFVADWSLSHLTNPVEMLQAAGPTSQPTTIRLASLIPLGGRWYYQPTAGQTTPPPLFDHTNVDRLLYKDGPPGPSEFEAPFAGNTSAYLRKGEKDEDGNIATHDELVADNVTIQFDSTSLILHTRSLPNHPTGTFPEIMPDGHRGNPSYIQEQEHTYYLRLNPRVNPAHLATDTRNYNHALNMGPIGIAVNGVVFFNPFDAQSTDASSAMDRCCGHPNQENLYHYHKYPICVNSPWADEGKAHSPLIGFAFDGFPIYGPYESANVMAKDLAGSAALNAFNIHFDPQRGWHYHVTPGKFPYIIGGYWGTPDRRDLQHPHPNREMKFGSPFGPDGDMTNLPPPPPPF